jgi:anti-anti-sigma factor
LNRFIRSKLKRINGPFILESPEFSTLNPMRDRELVYSINEGQRPGTIIIRLDGPLTLGNMFSFQTEVRTLQPPTTVFDLSSSEYMDSAGLGVLVNYYVSAERNGRKVALVGVNVRVHALLEMARVDKLLGVFPTIEEALANR